MTLLLSVLTICSPVGGPAVDCHPPAVAGFLSQYAPGLMAATMEVRVEWGELPPDLPPDIWGIAVLDCERIGELAYLSIEGGEWFPVMISDCSGHWHTTAWMEQAGIIAEVDYRIAEMYGFVGRGGVRGMVRYLN